MNEFLNYSIYGIMTVQTYLIVGAVIAVLIGAFSKKSHNFAKLVCKGLVWPVPAIMIIALLILSAFAGLLALIEKVRK